MRSFLNTTPVSTIISLASIGTLIVTLIVSALITRHHALPLLSTLWLLFSTLGYTIIAVYKPNKHPIIATLLGVSLWFSAVADAQESHSLCSRFPRIAITAVTFVLWHVTCVSKLLDYKKNN